MKVEKMEKASEVITAVMIGYITILICGLAYGVGFTLMARHDPDPLLSLMMGWLGIFIPISGIAAIYLSLVYLSSKRRERNIIRTIDPDFEPIKSGSESEW